MRYIDSGTNYVRITTEFWQTTSIKPIMPLAILHKLVLERTTKRMPKWQFRLASDIVVQIQPKVRLKGSGRSGFECVAFFNSGVEIKFLLVMTHPVEPQLWGFRATSAKRPGLTTGDDAMSLQRRLIELLPTVLSTLRTEIMLRPACLICGKRLTDPISQARWIGPECNQSAGALNPYLIKLRPPAPTQIEEEIAIQDAAHNVLEVVLTYDLERDCYTCTADGAPLMRTPHLYIFPCPEAYRRQVAKDSRLPDVLVEFDDWPHYVYPQPDFDDAVVTVGDTVRVIGLSYPEPDFDAMAEQD
jgi:hypothetical protein